MENNEAMQATQQSVSPKKRVGSIDALRGITLLGILVVHTIVLYGYNKEILLPLSDLDNNIIDFVKYFFINRCNSVFAILFGLSFYLIMKNPKYSIGRFIWRCVLLIGIGLIAKLFFTFDALMWYGICGIILCSFKKCDPKIMLVIAFILFSIGVALVPQQFGTQMFGTRLPERYVEGATLCSVLSYPMIDSIKDYLFGIFNENMFGCLSRFIIGYALAKMGVIENLDNLCNKRNVLIAFAICAVLTFVSPYYAPLFFYTYLLDSLFYAMLFVFIYNKASKYLHFLENYGRLGLSNYFMQGVLGVTYFTVYGIPNKVSVTVSLLTMLGVYCLQILFSTIWLKNFKFGPFEWIWRCLTSFKFISMRIKQ